MIDPKNRTIQALIEQGYRLTCHAYLKAGDRVKYTFVAKDPVSGKVLQGWSRSGGPEALKDLARRAGLGT